MTEATFEFRGLLPQMSESRPPLTLSLRGGPEDHWAPFASRTFDLVIAGLAILFLLPLLVAVATAVFLEDGGPVLYKQNRIGRSGRVFGCLKFRSMRLDADAALAALLTTDAAARAEWARDQKLRADPRITRVGAFIRRWSLDELAQFFNVLRGDMSVVGPRPIVRSEIPRYGRRFAHYCKVRPGITGLWQVSGRNNVSYRRRVAMDTLYVRSKALGRDLAILLLTVPAVLARDGAY